jgi:hypothetical protein
VGPFIENPLPVVPSFEMVVLEEREFVSTTGTVELDPIITGPNDTIEGLAVASAPFPPAPETASTSVAFEASLEKLIVPYVHPLAVGAKFMLTSTLCPAGKTNGSVKLDAVNSELLAEIAETVTLVSPLFIRLTSKVSDWPRTTPPKSRLLGMDAS